MPNIVVIDDDKKVVQEYTTFIQQMGQDFNVQGIDSPALFLKLYKNSVETLDEAKAVEYFSDYEFVVLKDLAKTSFTDKASFKAQSVIFTLDDSWTVKKISTEVPSTVFNQTPEQIIGSKLETLAGTESTQVLEETKKRLSEDNTTASNFIVFRNGQDYWLCLAEFTYSSETTMLKLINYSDKAKEFLLKVVAERSGDDSSVEPFASVDLVILRVDLIDENINDWIFSTLKQLKVAGKFPEEGRPRFILSTYSSEKEKLVDKSKYSSQLIEDLIYLPLDRLIVMQKIEIILNLPEKVKPSYLFSQPVEMEIDFTKRSYIEQINDIGIGIRNPVALEPGTPSLFYFRLPGSESLTFSHAKVSKSIEHPEDSSKFLVYFDFFGIEKEQAISIKAELRKTVDYKDLLSIEDSDFEYHEENIFLTSEDKRMKTAVVIDSDRDTLNSAANSLKENFHQLYTISCPTYIDFYKKYLASDESIPLQANEIYDEAIQFRLNKLSLELEDVTNAPRVVDSENTPDADADVTLADLICERDAAQFFAAPMAWQNIFFEDEEMREHVLSNLKDAKVKPQQVLVELQHANGEARLAVMKYKHIEHSIEVTIEPPNPIELSEGQINALDVMVISSNVLPENVNAWAENLNRLCAEKFPTNFKNRVKIIVTAEKTFSKKQFNQCYNSPYIDALLYKPAESRILGYHVSRLSGCKFTKYNPDNIGWYTRSIQAYAGKTAKLEELSEFGATLKNNTPLKVGTIVFFHRGIYDKAPNNNLCARVYAVEKHPEENAYLCHFIYFGINDSFLKFTRSWIRDNYAQQKAEGESG